ncbi:MAG: hypothetical protein K1X31_10170 [Gemmatimonadaceae bacterium]|nr:hypothetical protein [Gemmatimonadaceae bacterium]
MLALGMLAVAFQVQVNVARDSAHASASISVRPPRYQVAVTDEHRRTAFRDATARDLLLRARAARLQQDSTLLSYEVKSYQRISAGMALRETARDRLMFRQESAAHVRWRRGVGAHVEMLGARSAVPIVAGLKEAEKEMEDDMWDEIGDMMAIPYYPGKDELWLFDNIGSGDGDGPMLIHPVAEGSEAYFTFATGDSVLIALPDGKRITLREIVATPREARWNLVVGSFWFETDGAHLVRAVMRFSAPMDVWETVEQEDSTARDDVPPLVRGLISPMKAEITAVTIEYGLLDQRYWLPRTQGAEGYARVSFIRVPFRIEERYRYDGVNGIDTLTPIPPPTWKRNADVQDSLKASGLDSAQVRQAMEKYYATRDSVNRADRLRQCETSGTFRQVQSRDDMRLRMVVDIPCDRDKLVHSPELPPSIYDDGEELFGAKERNELMQALDFALQPAWAPRPPSIEWGLNHTRYNRVEGLGTGALVTTQLGKGYKLGLGGRFSLADLQPNGEFSLARSNGRRELRGAVYRRLAVSSDFGTPLTFGASVPALLWARDEGFYHRAWGGELTGTRVSGNGFEWRLFAEQQWDAPVETRYSVFGGANDDRFIGNVTADQAWLYGAGVRWRGSRGLDPRGWRASADVRLEGASVDFAAAPSGSYGRAYLETTVSRGLGRLAASLTGAAGTTAGDVPAQRHFFLGGLHSVRGQTAGTGYGEAFWMGRLEIGENQAAARPVIFGDLGWAGPRDGWSNVGRPMSGVGVGASFLDGMIRFDVSRGIYPRVQTRVDLYLEARF